MIRINLLPVRAARKKETLKQQLFIAAMAVLTVIALCIYMDFSQRREMEKIQVEINKNKAEIARLKTVIGEVGKLKARKKSLEDKTRVIEQLKNNRSGPVRMMDELSAVIPQKAWITNMTENGQTIKLAAFAVNEEVISDFMINMERSPYFSDIKLSKITSKSGKGAVGSNKSFGLTASIRDPNAKNEPAPEINNKKKKKKKKRKR